MIFTEKTVRSNPHPPKSKPQKDPSFASRMVIRMDLKVCEGKWLGQKAGNRYRWSLQVTRKRGTTVMWLSRSRQGVGENVNIKLELKKKGGLIKICWLMVVRPLWLIGPSTKLLEDRQRTRWTHYRETHCESVMWHKRNTYLKQLART